MPYWDTMLEEYYNGMGWDRKTGKPLPATLKNLDLEDVVEDLWPTSSSGNTDPQ